MKLTLIAFGFAALLTSCFSGLGQENRLPARVPGVSADTNGYLSPCALAASPGGETLFIACATANQILQYDVVRGEISRRVPVPSPPSGLAISRNGQRLYATCAGAESQVCVVDAASGKLLATIPTGHSAMAPVLSRDEQTLFVCNRFNDAVAVIDLQKKKELARISVEREPVAAALTPDGKLLFVANHIHTGRADVGVVAASVTVVDTETRQVIKHIPLPNGSTLLRGVCSSPDGRYMAVTHILARFHLPATQVTHGWMNDNALSLIDVSQRKLLNTVLLDNVEQGAANPWAVAWSKDGKFLCVTHAGTHELSMIDAPALLAKLMALPVKLEANAPPDYSSASRVAADVPNDLAFLVGLRTRIKLAGNGPRALALIGNQAFCAHYFSDSLDRIELEPPVRTLGSRPLGAAKDLSLVRRGEMWFNDGSLCFQGWQSCGSCHSSDARVDGMDWDLLNDGIGNPKNVKSLLFAFQTGPAMALGVRPDAAAAVRAGIRHILFAVLPEEYPLAIDAYLQSLQPTSSPYLVRGQLSRAAQRGKKLFLDENVGCASCHPPPLFTDLKPHHVGAGKFDHAQDRFYTPTLVELWRTAPYLHDGSAATLRDAVITHNRDAKLQAASQLSAAQLDDLVAYLQSL